MADIVKRKLYADIETMFNLCGVFQTGYNINVGPETILQERQIACICYRWAHERKGKVHKLRWDPRAKDPNRKDEAMLITFSKVWAKADEVIAQNGKRFDVPWIRGRIAILDLDPLPEVTLFDTLLKNRQWFNFNSYKQDYIDKLMGGTGKIPMRFQDWIDVYHNKPGALKRMVEYCSKDILDLERNETKLRRHIPEKYSKGLEYIRNGKICECGGKLYIKEHRTTHLGILNDIYRCKDCRKTYTDNRQRKD